MNRRELITLIGGAAAWPLAARAQQPTKVPRVGILTPAVTDATPALQAFHRGIRDLGYVEGQTIALAFDTPSDERALQTPNWSQPGPTSVRPGWPLSACPLSGCV